MITPNQSAEKWNRRLKASTEDIKNGVNNVTVAPTQKAAAASTKWQAKLAAADTKARFENGLKRVSLEDWKTAMIDKGIGRIAAGADAGQSKFESFAADFLPFLAGVKSKVDAMPSLTLEDSINRMTTQVREVAKYRRK